MKRRKEFSWSDFTPRITFGRGKNGTTIQGYVDSLKGHIYAIKSISKSLSVPQYLRQLEKLKNEFRCLSHLHDDMDDEHRENENYCRRIRFYSVFILQAYGLLDKEETVSSSFQPKPLYLCLEAVLGGTLFQNLYNEKDNLDYFAIQRYRVYITQMINILLFLFSKRLIHRDIKLSNLMVNSFGHIKLIDFDLARYLHPEESKAFTICGTLHLMAPEMIASEGRERDKASLELETYSGCGYDFSVDWWSIGHLLYEMILMRPLPLEWHKEEKGPRPIEEEKRALISAEQRMLAQRVIQTEEEYIGREWSFSAASEWPWLRERVQKKTTATDYDHKNDNNIKCSTSIDFSSFVPSSSSYSSPEEMLSLLDSAEDLVGRLLTVSPLRRYGISSLYYPLAESSLLHQRLVHPFLVEEMLFPRDLETVRSREDYLKMLRSRHRFSINEKIGFYEMFPMFQESRVYDRLLLQKTEKGEEVLEDPDQLTEEQQALFRDF